MFWGGESTHDGETATWAESLFEENRDLFSFFLTNFVGTQLIVPSATKFYQWRPTFLAVARSDWLGEIIENAIFGSTLGRGLYFSLTLLFLSPCTTSCGGPNNSSFKI